MNALPPQRSASLRHPAVFLDRDGVINVDGGYLFRPADLVFTPTAEKAIRLLNAAGVLAIVVTNQSGIARGYYSLDDVTLFHDAMHARLREAGAHLDAVYCCPYHPDGHVAPFAVEHEDRKPAPGMLLRAMRDFPIDAGRSLMIGDRDSDMVAAARAGVRGERVVANVCDLAAVVASFLRTCALS